MNKFTKTTTMDWVKHHVSLEQHRTDTLHRHRHAVSVPERYEFFLTFHLVPTFCVAGLVYISTTEASRQVCPNTMKSAQTKSARQWDLHKIKSQRAKHHIVNQERVLHQRKCLCEYCSRFIWLDNQSYDSQKIPQRESSCTYEHHAAPAYA